MSKLKKLLIPLLLVVSILFTGCSEFLDELDSALETVDDQTVEETVAEETQEIEEAEETVTESEAIETEFIIEETEYAINPDGVYTTAEDVALYLHTYGVLPGNFITKSEARALGWDGGSLEEYAPGMCIGGDYFGNYEGVLPEGVTYHECDINTLGASSRGAERLVFSDDGDIYYTGDHYETFELLYEGA
ncbi:MAG: ribonuclease [Saccharofermentans sp.]|nr:ribonuclease [Saccharofermentans sp.]